MNLNSRNSFVRMGFGNHRSIVLLSLGVWILAFAAPTASRSDVIFTNFGPGHTYDTTEGNPVGNAFDGNDYAEGDTFTPSASVAFSSLLIALSCVSACPDAFDVSLTQDNGDQPGLALESFTVPGGSLGPLSANNPPLVLDSVLMPLLTAGTRYWITAEADLNDSIAWNFNSTGDVADHAISADNAATWFSPSGMTPGAFEVDGVTVPEPASSVLLATILLLLSVLGKLGTLLRNR